MKKPKPSIKPFSPVIYTRKLADGEQAFLVCANRSMSVPSSLIVKEIGIIRNFSTYKPPNGCKLLGEFDRLVHLAAIGLSGSITLCIIDDSDSEWEVIPVDQYKGISLTKKICTVALEIAWRGRKRLVDPDTDHAHCAINKSVLNAKNGSAKWKIVCALFWNEFAKLSLSMEHRAGYIRSIGFPKVTAKAVQKFAENEGL